MAHELREADHKSLLGLGYRALVQTLVRCSTEHEAFWLHEQLQCS